MLILQIIVIYLLFLLMILLVGFSWFLWKKYTNHKLGVIWLEEKNAFQREVENFLVDPQRRLPPEIATLRRELRPWALGQLVDYQDKLTGISNQTFQQLLLQAGFTQEINSWISHRRWWKRLEGVGLVNAFSLKEEKGQVIQLLGDSKPVVRLHAFRCLGRIGTREDLPLMLEFLEQNDFRWFQSEAVIHVLNQVDMTEVQGKAAETDPFILLHSLFFQVQQPFNRRCLLELMGRQGMYNSIPFLQSLLYDPEPEPELRMGAIKSLIQLNAYQAIPQLAKLLDSPRETSGVKIMAMKGIATLADLTNEELLIENLGHPLWWVRYYSGFGLAQLGELGLTKLAELAEEHPDRYGREMSRYFYQLTKEDVKWTSLASSL